MDYDNDNFEDYYDYSNYYNCGDYDDSYDPISLSGDGFSEKALEDCLTESGLCGSKAPWYKGDLEKLIFTYGERKEIYSSLEIKFIEKIPEVYVYPEFVKELKHGNMVCHVISTKFDDTGEEALSSCVSFEKIVDKALDGFNIFFLITGDSVFLGCKLFEKEGNHDCIISKPISTQTKFELLIEELASIQYISSFLDYYEQLESIILSEQSIDNNYDDPVSFNREVELQSNYLDEINELGEEENLDVSGVTRQYWESLQHDEFPSFASQIEDVEESLSYIKPNKVNPSEMLFAANELLMKSEEEQERDEQYNQTANNEENIDINNDIMKLIDDPEELVKYLKNKVK